MRGLIRPCRDRASQHLRLAPLQSWNRTRLRRHQRRLGGGLIVRSLALGWHFGSMLSKFLTEADECGEGESEANNEDRSCELIWLQYILGLNMPLLGVWALERSCHRRRLFCLCWDLNCEISQTCMRCVFSLKEKAVEHDL